MAAFNRPTNATYETHENVTIDTQDKEDHTFCGVMFPIKCKDLLPVDHLVVKSVAVRGRLGPLTVWVSKNDANSSLSNGDQNQRYRTRSTRNTLARRAHNREGGDLPNTQLRIPLDPSSWTKLYDKKHNPCPPGHYTELVFDEPFRLKPGEMRALYIHSTLPGDQAIVYDNSYYGSSDKRFEDDKISILTGRAHVSTTCFGQDPIWGWGNAWRDRREFVGRLSYGTVYKLWNPEVQPKFGSSFQNGARALFLCQRRWESPFSGLPDEAIFYILNMCRWDWFDDSINNMKDRRKREKARNTLLAMKRQEEEDQEEMESATSMTGPPMNEDDKVDAKLSAKGVASTRYGCNQSFVSAGVAKDDKTTGLNDSEEEDEDYVDMSDDGDDKDDGDMPVDGEDDDITVNSDDGEFESDESSEDDDEYHRANRRYFSFQYPDSDEETEKSTSSSLRNDSFRHQFARVHVLRALASMEDQAISQF